MLKINEPLDAAGPQEYTSLKLAETSLGGNSSNYATLKQSDSGEAELTKKQENKHQDATVKDNYGYLQLLDSCEVAAVPSLTQLQSSHNITRLLLFDDMISPSDITVIQHTQKIHDGHIPGYVDNTNVTSCMCSTSPLDGDTSSSDKDNVANTVYRSEADNVADSVLYNGNANNEYDVINDVDVDTYDEIATAEDGVGVYNEVSTDNMEYAEVDIRPDGVRGEGADIYNELQDTYGTNQSTEKHIFSITSGISWLSSLSGEQRIVVITVLLLIMLAVAAALAFVILRNDGVLNMASKRRQIVRSATVISNITRAGCNMFNCIMIASAVPGGRVLTECNNKLLIVSAANSSQVTEVPQLLTSLQDALWMPDGQIVCTTNKKPVAVWRLTSDGNITARTSSITGELSYSADGNVTYLASFTNGVYRSIDNGETWSLVLNMTDDMYHYEYVVQVSNDTDLNTYDLWTVEHSYVKIELNQTHKHEKAKRSVASNNIKVQQNLTFNNGRVTIRPSIVHEKVTNPIYVYQTVKSIFGGRKLKHNSTNNNGTMESRPSIGSNASSDEQLLTIVTSRLRIYTMHTHSHVLLSQRTIAIPDNITLKSAYLAYDSHGNVFLSDWVTSVIHLLSAREGSYERQLVNLTDFQLRKPTYLSIDVKNSVMYIGLCDGVIATLALTYEN